MAQIVLGEGSVVQISGAEFPLKGSATVEVDIPRDKLLALLDLTEEQHRLLQLGATLFQKNSGPAPRGRQSGGAAPKAPANGGAGGTRKRTAPETQDPWSGKKVFSPGFGHFSDETRTLTGIEKDRGKAKLLGTALRAAREKNGPAVARIIDQYTGRFTKAEAGDKKKLLADIIRELKEL